jgi:hypothetical protein
MEDSALDGGGSCEGLYTKGASSSSSPAGGTGKRLSRKRKIADVVNAVQSQLVESLATEPFVEQIIHLGDRGFACLDKVDVNEYILTHTGTREKVTLVGDEYELVYDDNPFLRHGAIAGVVDGEPVCFEIREMFKRELVETTSGLRRIVVDGSQADLHSLATCSISRF